MHWLTYSKSAIDSNLQGACNNRHIMIFMDGNNRSTYFRYRPTLAYTPIVNRPQYRLGLHRYRKHTRGN